MSSICRFSVPQRTWACITDRHTDPYPATGVCLYLRVSSSTPRNARWKPTNNIACLIPRGCRHSFQYRGAYRERLFHLVCAKFCFYSLDRPADIHCSRHRSSSFGKSHPVACSQPLRMLCRQPKCTTQPSRINGEEKSGTNTPELDIDRCALTA